MANITKTVLFPVPTVWMGQAQDTSRTGICTYVGPQNITFWYENKGSDASPDWHQMHSFETGTIDRDPPADAKVVTLDADLYPMNAIACYGGIEGPYQIETPAGPDSEPNPILNDYLHFQEVFDMLSLEYDHTNNKWPRDPVFSSDATEWNNTHSEGNSAADSHTFGWDWVRTTRNQLLENSDDKIPNDAPTGFSSPWKDYRQKLRDLPTTWAGVGTETYRIVWPHEPDDTPNIGDAADTSSFWNSGASKAEATDES